MSLRKLYRQKDSGLLIISSSKKELEKEYKLDLLFTIYGYNMGVYLQKQQGVIRWRDIKHLISKI